MEAYHRIRSEEEALSEGERYCAALVRDLPVRERQYVSVLESSAFLPALSLQVAAVAALSGQPRDSLALPISFAFYVIDHLSVGWATMLASHFRVAHTMTRAAVEGAIFEAASALSPDRFEEMWQTSKGTGGALLPLLKGQIEADIYDLFEKTWRSTRSFSHASVQPVITSAQKVADEYWGDVHAMTFGGPYFTDVNVYALLTLAKSYVHAASVGLEAAKIALLPHLPDSSMWYARYKQFWSGSPAE